MKSTIYKQLTITSIAIFGLIAGSGAFAATTADDSITNTAELLFTVGGGSTLELESSEAGNETLGNGNGTATSFDVDRLIDFGVAEVSSEWNSDDTEYAADGQETIVLEYEITNDTNYDMGFNLYAELNGVSIATPAGFTATTGNVFTPTGVTIAVDNPSAGGTAGVYDAAFDTATVVDLVDQEDTIRVFVILDVPTGTDQDDYALVTLVAQAMEPTGTGISGASAGDLITEDDNNRVSPGGVASDILNANTTVQDVFNDNAGDASYNFVTSSSFLEGGDTIGNGQASDTDGVLINGARLSLNKDVVVIWDPINANDKPKAIPGAYVSYSITIENNGDTASVANLTSLADTLASELTFDLGILGLGCTEVTTPGATCNSIDNSQADYPTAKTALVVAFAEYDAVIGTGVDFDLGYASGSVVTVSGLNITVNYDQILTTANLGGATRTAGDLNGGESITITFNGVLQ